MHDFEMFLSESEWRQPLLEDEVELLSSSMIYLILISIEYL